MTVQIPLGDGFVALMDDEDAERFPLARWRLWRSTTRLLYARRRHNGVQSYMHRDVMSAGRGEMVDHIDGNGLNNQRANLRFCSHAENMRNQRKTKVSKTGYKGVKKEYYRYSARITVDGTRIRLGTHGSAIEAALAYDEAARRYFGEFAAPNFPAPKP